MGKYDGLLDMPMSTILVKDLKACMRCGWFPYHCKIYCEGCGGLPETVRHMSIKDCLELARDRTTDRGWGGSTILGVLIGYFERCGEPGWGINNPNGGVELKETRHIYLKAKHIVTGKGGYI